MLWGVGDAECEIHSDCDDGTICTNDYCRDGACEYELADEPRATPNYGTVLCSLDRRRARRGGWTRWECALRATVLKGVCVEDFCEDICRTMLPRFDGGCTSAGNWFPTGLSCEWDGLAGVCIEGQCRTDHRLCRCRMRRPRDLCTGDLCDLDSGECYYQPKSCPSDYDECTDDKCDPQTGDCFHPPMPDGYFPADADPEDDGGPCCDGTMCAAKPCHAGACDSETRVVRVHATAGRSISPRWRRVFLLQRGGLW